MRVLLVFVFIILSVRSTLAGDEHFSKIQPFDDYVKAKLKWDDTQKAALISDYTQYTMLAAPFVIQLGKDRVLERLGGVLAAEAGVSALTHLTKTTSKRVRPNGSGTASFFSGHTSAAFTGAGIICNDEPKLCPAALALAATTGYMRIAANRHWASDVIVGAWFGYAGGQLIPSIVLQF